jgi:HlyD family secretion protein
MAPESHAIDQWYRGVSLSAKGPALAGACILVLWVGCFGMWAGLAPLSGAVVAPGTFVATGQNKLVQHFEGGIIRDLLVKEGDLVEPNQVLVRMDDTAAKAKLRRLVLRKYRLLTMRARLDAEIRGSEEFAMPPELAATADDEVRAIFNRQVTELRARRANAATEESVLRKQIAGLEESIGGYQAQAKSTKERMVLFAEELKDKNSLYERALSRKTDLLSLQRAAASLEGELGELMGRIADANERVARANQEIAHLKSAATQKSVQELRETETELDDVQEQIRAAQDVVERVDVRAPVRGIVVKQNFHTPGGVAGAGAVLLELLPVGDELIIEAQVHPRDITHVATGQMALVRLSALKQRITPMVQARVIYVSADALTEQSSLTRGAQPVRRDFYIVRVKLDEADIRKHMHGFRPTPGMPADVYIKTGERTFFTYIMRPVLDTLSRSFRES